MDIYSPHQGCSNLLYRYRVAFARQAYNDAVMGYNNKCEVFPNSIIAGNFDFKPAQLLEIESPEKRAVPKVSFT